MALVLFVAGCQTTVVIDPKNQEIKQPRKFLDLLPLNTQAPKPRETKYTIGVLMPFSGKDKKLGEGFYNAAKLALFSHTDHDIGLMPLDTKGTPEGAEEAMERAIAGKVDAIIGPIRANEVRAIHYKARHNRIPVIAFTNDLRAQASGILIFGFDVQEQVMRVFSYAHQQGLASVAAILPQNEYGLRNQEALERAKHNGLIKNIDFYFYAPRGQKFIEDLSYLKGKSYDSLYIPEGGGNLKTIISSLLYHQVDIHTMRLVGSGQWLDDDIKLMQTLQKSWFTAPLEQGFSYFQNLYYRQYKHNPLRIYTLAFDAVQVLAQLSQKHAQDPFNLNHITSKQGFMGIDGLFRFTADGDTERGLAVYSLIGKEFKVLSPAPKSFL